MAALDFRISRIFSWTFELSLSSCSHLFLISIDRSTTMGKSTGKSPARRSPGRASSPAKKVKGKKKVQHFTKYQEYANGLQGSLLFHAEKKQSAKVFYLRFKGFKGVKILRRADGFVFEHPDNPKNLIEFTPETFKSAMARTRQDFELSRGKQPNARMKGVGAKDGFHKNVAPNNDAYSLDGKDMNKWTTSIYWGDNESRGTSGTVNEAGYDFLTGKTVLGDEDGAAFDKRDYGIEDMEREVQNLDNEDDGEADDEEDDDSEMEEEEEEDDSEMEEEEEEDDSEMEMEEADSEMDDEEEDDDDDDSEEDDDDDDDSEEDDNDDVQVVVEQQQQDDDDSSSDDDDEDGNNPLHALQLALQKTPQATQATQATQAVQQAKEISIKSLKSIVRRAKGSRKVDLMKSAIEVGTVAQLKHLHKLSLIHI